MAFAGIRIEKSAKAWNEAAATAALAAGAKDDTPEGDDAENGVAMRASAVSIAISVGAPPSRRA